MNSELTCVDCGNVFFGGIHSSFGNGLGVCSICQSSRKANERFEKEMSQRERHYNSSYSSSSGAKPWEGRISLSEEQRQWDLLRKAFWFSIVLAVFLTPLKIVDFSTISGMIVVYCLTVVVLFAISVFTLLITLPFQNRL